MYLSEFFVKCDSLNDKILILGEEKDEDQTTIKIPSEMMNSKDINQSKETDIEKTDVSKGISYDKGKIIKDAL